ncbi:hypothetical protein NM688_g2933 [Phlebia brevispora]|uniref:Uncharacterized protein n=1 Tax=Phlebia brevispora TaxID=194682 RepID=A0ACC1T7A0_9APHY|nr:hypothetical protein NM688_g2933 [Phlebia brevispora]
MLGEIERQRLPYWDETPMPRGLSSRGPRSRRVGWWTHISATPSSTPTAFSPFTSTMNLPTSREIELETLLRQRDAQVADLTVSTVKSSTVVQPGLTCSRVSAQDEVTHLRQYLLNQPAPSHADQISLPPPLVSLLLPHIKDRSLAATGSTSGTITAALTQRVKVLQEENDELYELLKTGETGRLKEDVRSLRRVVQKLEGALKGTLLKCYAQTRARTKLADSPESHQVITNLSYVYLNISMDTPNRCLERNWRNLTRPSSPIIVPTILTIRLEPTLNRLHCELAINYL